LLEEHRGVLRGLFPKHQGTEIKTTGDGFLVEFASALAAVQCAVEIQRVLAERNQAQPAERQVRIRIGIHLGDVVGSAGDVHGDGVNIAARIKPLAIGGGIVLSDTVDAQVRTKPEMGWTKLDTPHLKHIEVPMDIYRVALPWEPSGSSRRQEARTFKSAVRDPHPAIEKSLATSAATKRGRIAVGVVLVAGRGGWLGHGVPRSFPTLSATMGLVTPATRENLK
jgi:hypothetical protein